MKDEVAQRIRKYRKKAGLTQEGVQQKMMWSLALVLSFLAFFSFSPGPSYAQQPGPLGVPGTGALGPVPTSSTPTPPGAPTSQPAPTGITPSPSPGTPGVTTPTAIPPAQPAPAQSIQPPTPSPSPVAPPQAEVKSPYELSYSSPVPQEVSRNLKQFGYDLFTSPASTFAPVTDVPVGPDYVLGPGDTLQVYMWGLVENVFTLPVNRKGEIFLPKVGTLPVWGMTFSQVDTLIRDQLSRYFSGFRLSLAMGELRTIKVFVVGEVSRPGSYTLSSLSTAFNALFAAGGPTKLGTLRNIRLIRNNHTVGTIDLYEFLLKGDKSQDYRLESGDTVFVPPIGPVVGIAGNVKRPAIYELRGPTHIADLIEMAGGVLPVGYLQRVQIERVQAHAEKIVVDFDLSQFYTRKDTTANIELLLIGLHKLG